MLTTFTRLMDYNNGFSFYIFFLSLLSFLWIGAQFPQEKFLSYARILTFHYYFLLSSLSYFQLTPLKKKGKVMSFHIESLEEKSLVSDDKELLNYLL
jgi:hypothetical protein